MTTSERAVICYSDDKLPRVYNLLKSPRLKEPYQSENFQLEGTWTSVSLSYLSLRKYPLGIYFENNSKIFV